MIVTVKVVGDKAYIKKGVIGVGFGAWGRAGSIKVQLGLPDFPKSVSEHEWRGIDADKILEVDTEARKKRS